MPSSKGVNEEFKPNLF